MIGAIQIITTGGTIDKAYFDALSAYQVGESIVGRLLQAARVTHPFELREFARKDSLDFDNGDRARLGATIRALDAERIVIAHGTDTMTETAAALSDIPGKTIVLFGALNPARFAETDAPFNLGMAFAACQIAAPGVYITMNGTVFPHAAVAKDRAAGTFVFHGAARGAMP